MNVINFESININHFLASSSTDLFWVTTYDAAVTGFSSAFSTLTSGSTVDGFSITRLRGSLMSPLGLDFYKLTLFWLKYGLKALLLTDFVATAEEVLEPFAYKNFGRVPAYV